MILNIFCLQKCAMKVEWDVKIERGRKSSTSKSGAKSLERDRLERERLALEMAEKVSFW